LDQNWNENGILINLNVKKKDPMPTNIIMAVVCKKIISIIVGWQAGSTPSICTSAAEN